MLRSTLPATRLWTFLAASGSAFLLNACGSHHVETHLPQGLVYICDPGGALTIRFNGGGYQPGATVRAIVDGRPGAVMVPRSTAMVTFGQRELRMVPEHTERGLRYRSEVRYDGEHYLIWTQRGETGGERGNGSHPEAARSVDDARLGHRTALEVPTDSVREGERLAEGDAIAICRRVRRVAAEPAPHGGPGQHPPTPAPHRR